MGVCASNPKTKKDVAADSSNIIKAEANLLGANDAVLSECEASPEPKLSKEPSLKAITVSLPTNDEHVDLGKAAEAPQLSVEQLEKLTARAIVDEYQHDAIILKDSVSRIEEFLRSRPQAGTAGVDTRQQPHASPPAQTAQAAVQDPTPPSPAAQPSLEERLAQDPQIALASKKHSIGRVLAAWRILKKWCEANSCSPTDLEPHSFVLGFRVSELEEQCTRVNECLRLLQDDSGFLVSRDDGDLRVLYKCIGKVHHIKMDAVLPHPLDRPLSLAREFDLMSSWNKYIVESQLLHAPSIWESTVCAGLWMPFPFPHVDALGTGRGFDLSEEDKSLLVLMESIEEEDIPPGALPLTAKSKKRHRAEVQRGSCIRLEALKPLADGTPQTRGTILQIVNPHVPHVPAFIVNFVLGVMAPFAHREIVKLLKEEFDDPSKPFPKRMAAQPELYERVRTVVREGLLEHYGVTVDS